MQDDTVQSKPLAPTPVSGPNKEVQPRTDLGNPSETYISPSGEETRVEISPRVAEAGVKDVTDRPPLPPGVNWAKEATPPLTVPTGLVRMSAAQAEITSKGNTLNAVVWIAELFKKYWKQVRGEQLKNV